MKKLLPLLLTALSCPLSGWAGTASNSFQAPWQYLWYSLVAVVYGAAVTLFIMLIASLMVYLGKWGVSRALLSESTNQKPDYLFIYAPESFGWKELFLKGTPIEVEDKAVSPAGQRKVVRYDFTKPAEAEAYKKSYTWWNYAGAGMVTFWLVLFFLLMLGCSYSFFWSAGTMIYLLMRRRVDEVDIDEVYLEDDTDAPLAPPPSPPVASTDKPGAASLPMVPPPPATVPFTPPVSTAPAAGTVPPAADGEVKVTPPTDGAK